MRCNRAEALPDIADMKANSSNYGSTVPEVTADLLADEPAQSTLGRFQTTCEFCGRFMFERDERRDYAVCPTCEHDRARSRARLHVERLRAAGRKQERRQ